MVPNYLCVDGSVVFCKCTDSQCDSHFIVRREAVFDELIPNHEFRGMAFSETIKTLSGDFVQIYNEAFSAEQMALNQICGVGYRKAFEFLVKDYVMRNKTDDEKERVKKMPLAKCIEEHVDNDNVKTVAKRAVWLGNDETHYVRKWEKKDVKDLKDLISLTIWWIEQTIKTEEILRDMPEKR